MADRLLQLARNRWTAPLVRTLGLPEPPTLRRRGAASEGGALGGRPAAVLSLDGGHAADAARDTLRALGATPADEGPLDVLVADLTATATVDHVAALRALLQPAVQRLRSSARVVLLAPPPAATPEAAAASAAIAGFVRSLAKELGRRGATVNALVLHDGAAADLRGALAFFCGDRGAYVTGQLLALRGGTAPALAPGRSALVTGAAGGIGAATVRRLAADGWHVVCVDVPQATGALTALAATVGGSAVAIDLTAPDGASRMQAAAAARGGLDLLVHNAGITRDRTFGRMGSDEWHAVLDVNLRAIVAADALLDRVGGLNAGAREVCLASIGGIAGNAGQTNYAATKAALIGYVQARDTVLAAHGGAANAVAPGFIETAMTQRMPLFVREAGRRLNSLRQGGLPDDVAEAIAFLGHPDAAGVHGQTLRVCGQSLLGA